jgi:hypothetical protein
MATCFDHIGHIKAFSCHENINLDLQKLKLLK